MKKQPSVLHISGDIYAVAYEGWWIKLARTIVAMLQFPFVYRRLYSQVMQAIGGNDDE